MGNREIILEISVEPASDAYAVVAQHIIDRGHCTFIRRGASADARDDDMVAGRGCLIGEPVVGVSPGDSSGVGVIDAPSQQEQSVEADNDTSPGVGIGNPNFKQTGVHCSFSL